MHLGLVYDHKASNFDHKSWYYTKNSQNLTLIFLQKFKSETKTDKDLKNVLFYQEYSLVHSNRATVFKMMTFFGAFFATTFRVAVEHKIHPFDNTSQIILLFWTKSLLVLL